MPVSNTDSDPLPHSLAYDFTSEAVYSKSSEVNCPLLRNVWYAITNCDNTRIVTTSVLENDEFETVLWDAVTGCTIWRSTGPPCDGDRPRSWELTDSQKARDPTRLGP